VSIKVENRGSRVKVEGKGKGKGEGVSIKVRVKVEGEGVSIEVEVKDEEEGSVRVCAEGEGEDRRVESGCHGGRKHWLGKRESVFRARHCTHSVGEQNEKQGTAVSRGTDQWQHVVSFCLFFQHVTLAHPTLPNPRIPRPR
jgi:acylphosphatase